MTKKFFNKSKLGRVFFYFWLVIGGYRDAYLIDGCSVNCDNVLEIVRCIYSSLAVVNIRLQFSLVTMALGPNHDDFLLIRSDILLEKLSNLYSVEWIDAPVIIDVNGSAPRLCTAEEVQSVKISLQQTFKLIRHSSSPYFPIIADTQFDAVVGFPFVAGWLLGYPCVYRSSNFTQKIDEPIGEGSASSHGNALSMTTLRKYSIHAQINDEAALVINGHSSNSSSRKCSESGKSSSSRGDRNSISHYGSTDVDLFEFTVPADIVDMETKNILDDWISNKKKEFERLTDCHQADADAILFVQSCAIQIEEMILPSVCL